MLTDDELERLKASLKLRLDAYAMVGLEGPGGIEEACIAALTELQERRRAEGVTLTAEEATVARDYLCPIGTFIPAHEGQVLNQIRAKLRARGEPS